MELSKKIVINGTVKLSAPYHEIFSSNVNIVGITKTNKYTLGSWVDDSAIRPRNITIEA